MLSVQNLTKTYVSKNGLSVKALSGVSFDIESRGLIFIVGKSGCGKSTLLNLLGGMDKPDGGSIAAFGKKTEELTERGLDEYRNESVGFIFQEYHLIEHLTAKENVALAMELQHKKADEKEFSALFESLEIGGQEDKLIDELSGGQKQRVAIARALIKQPRIILADEPTGALDSKTADALFETLKKISEERLIIVVTHDGKNAEKFGDRIIELSDGTVIRDEKIGKNAEEAIALEKDTNPSGKNKKLKLPLIHAFKLSLKGILKRKFRLIAAALTAIIALTALGIFASFLNYDRETVFVNSMHSTDNYYLPFNRLKLFSEQDFAELQNDFPSHSIKKNYALSTRLSGYGDFANFADKDTTDPLIKCGLSGYDGFEMNAESAKELKLKKLDGEFPAADNQIMLSKFTYECFKQTGYVNPFTGVAAPINSYGDLIGKKIYTTDNYSGDITGEFTVCGILDTNLSLKWYKSPTKDQLNDDTYINRLKYKLDYSLDSGLHRNFFVNDGYFSRYLSRQNLTNTKIVDFVGVELSASKGESYFGAGNLQAISKTGGFPYIKRDASAPDFTQDFPDGVVWKNDLPKAALTGGEVIVSMNTLRYFNTDDGTSVYGIINEKTEELILVFAQSNFDLVSAAIGEDFTNATAITYYNYILSQTKNGDNVYQTGKTYDYFYALAEHEAAKTLLNGRISGRKLTDTHEGGNHYSIDAEIVGIYFMDDSPWYKFIGTTFLSDSVCDELNQRYGYFNNYSLYAVLSGNQKKDVALVKSFGAMFRNANKTESKNAKIAALGNDIVESILKSEDTLKRVGNISAVAAGVVALLAFVVIFNYFSTAIVDDGKKIGILRAMGAKKSDVFSIYYLRSLLIAAVCAAMSLILTAIAIPLINNILYTKFYLNFSVLSFGIIPALAILSLSLITVTLASIIPIIKIAGKSPVQAIKDV